MSIFHAESLLFGLLAERPELSDPTIYSASGTALFLATDTGELYETSGSAWTLLGTILVAPGVVSNGLGGLEVGGNLDVRPPAGISYFLLAHVEGATSLFDTAPMATANARVLTVGQGQDIPLGGGESSVLLVSRTGSTALADYIDPALSVNDSSGSAQSVLQVTKQGTTVLDIGTRKSITGALSAVTDPNALDVLTSIIAALTGIQVATNNTT